MQHPDPSSMDVNEAILLAQIKEEFLPEPAVTADSRLPDDSRAISPLVVVQAFLQAQLALAKIMQALNI